MLYYLLYIRVYCITPVHISTLIQTLDNYIVLNKKNTILSTTPESLLWFNKFSLILFSIYIPVKLFISILYFH